ncbi:MAG: glycosyltransferase [Clostridia bacterium]|nr:glycosyltransferase [Clostridia bacterium]
MYSLSVIVPVYNSEKYLTKTLDSLAAQTVKDDMQIILIDDGSTDSSSYMCDDFASKRPDTVIIHRKNGGVSAARNAGLKEATGEYIGFVDADDTVAPDYFEKLLTAAKENDCDMAMSGFTLIFNSEERPNSPFADGEIFHSRDISEKIARMMLSRGYLNSVWSKIFRRSIIEEFEVKFPDGIKIGEDKRFILEFLLHCSSAVYAGNCGYYYYDVASSAMHSDKKMQQLISTDDDEMRIFVSLGLDSKTVREEKSAFLFSELADFLQRCYSKSRKEAKQVAKLHFSNDELMTKIDFAAKYIKQNNGTTYTLLATAFARRSVFLTLAVLYIQKKINERNA